MSPATPEEFLAAAEGQSLVPVWQDILADTETPVGVYWKLSHQETYSFLLESVTGGEQVGRYSFIGIRPRDVLQVKNRAWSSLHDSGTLTAGEDPLDLVPRFQLPTYATQPGFPPFLGGMVGMFAYDIVRYFERLPDTTKDDLDVPDLKMMLVDTVVVFDHARNSLRVITLADPSLAGYDAAQARVRDLVDRIRGPLPPLPTGQFPEREVTVNQTKAEFMANVDRMREYITQGDGVQMVPSQRFQVPLDAHPLTVYRALRRINPSPYMFFFRFGSMDIVGASPEILVSLHGERARVRPIAGTRWRGKSAEEDDALAAELLADQKEIAEHIMLVDLGRNDLGRVCEVGSVTVTELMVIERYSHVMHIVSDVRGTLRRDVSNLDLIRATFPAGTVSGAPKIRAMEIIDELEPTRRGLYAGAVGYLSAAGDLDLCIALRTILIKDGIAYVQAGGGVVYDSNAELEYNESCNKARAALTALARAQSGELD